MLCRVGSKRRFAKLLDFIAPSHTLYVEPFTGSGAFYWYKEPVDKEVVNDLDDSVIKTFKLIKKAPSDLSKYPQNLKTTEQLKAFWSKKPTTIPQQLTRQIITHCSGWMGKTVTTVNAIQREINPFNKLKYIDEYKERMSNTTVESMDYERLIKKYDSKDTFFFLDPPYEMSDGLGYAKGSESFDFERLARVLHSIKGKWLMTINDSPRIRGLFKDFHIAGITIRGHKANRHVTNKSGKKIGSEDRPELLVSNYALPNGWREHKGAYVL